MEPDDEYFSIEEIKAAINEFDKEHLISDIILLGYDGTVRRIKFDIENR